MKKSNKKKLKSPGFPTYQFVAKCPAGSIFVSSHKYTTTQEAEIAFESAFRGPYAIGENYALLGFQETFQILSTAP